MKGKFVKIVEDRFEDLKEECIRNTKRKGVEFDEDLWMDTYIKCAETLGDRDMSISEVSSYFWTSYWNGWLNRQKKQQPILVDEIDDNMIDEPYDLDMDLAYGRICIDLIEKFGVEKAEAFINHIGWELSYKELEEMGYKMKFNSDFKRMMRWIRLKYKDIESVKKV